MTSMDLRFKIILDEGAREIAQALKVNETITSVDLGSNFIGAAGAREIAEALGVNKAITRVDLLGNSIGDAGAIAIAEALKDNKTIDIVNLLSNHIEDEGAIAIAEALKDNKTINIVDLGNNYMGDEGARAIAEALKVNKTITTVDLSNNSIGHAGDMAIYDLIQRNTLFLRGSVEKLKRGEILDGDAYQTLAAHIDKSKKPNEPNKNGYSQNDFTRYIEKMHREVSTMIDRNHNPAMAKALTDPLMAATIREFLDVKSIANLQQAMRGNLLSLLSDLPKRVRESPALKTHIIKLDPATRSNLINDTKEKLLNKMAEEGKSWSIAKIIKHLPEESRSDLAGVVRKLYENPSFIENPKKRKFLADEIKENLKKAREPKHER